MKPKLEWIHARRYREQAGEGGDPGAGGGNPDPANADPGNGGGEGGDPGQPGGGDGGGESFFSSVPEDWRNQLAGEDESRLGRLERYTDFNSFVDSAFQAHDKLRAGEVNNGLPENPTEEQLTAWREANGVPVDGKYQFNLSEGLEINPVDEEVYNAAMQVAFENNISNDAMSQLVETQLKAQNAMYERVQAQDGIDKQESERVLKENWGADYDMNQNIINGFLAKSLGEETLEAFKNARLSNGMSVFNSPEIMNFLANTARTMDPTGTLVGMGMSKGVDVDARIKEIENSGVMAEPGWIGSKEEAEYDKLQAIVDARNGVDQGTYGGPND